MKQSSPKLLLIFMCLILVLSACSSPKSASSNAPADTSPSSSNSVEESTETEPPSDQPETTNSQDELKEKWFTPVTTHAFASGVCQTAQTTITKLRNGELRDTQLAREMLGVQIALEVAAGALEEWEASAELERYKVDMTNRLNNVTEVVAGWSDKTIMPDDVRSNLDQECELIEEQSQPMIAAAKTDGLTEEAFVAIADEAEERMSAEIESGTTAEVVVGEPIPTEVGLSRVNPFPLGEVGSASNWDLQILDVKRGEEAWQLVQTSSSIKAPPEEGMEYVFVYVKAKSTSELDEEHPIRVLDWRITGSHQVLYSYQDNSRRMVTPNPVLDASLYPGGETEGWLSYQVVQGESNLILMFDEISNWDEGSQLYFALEEGASISIAEDLKDIQPNLLGISRSEPARMQETIVTQDWEVTAVEFLRGEEAWSRIQAVDEYTSPPEASMEYILVKARVRYIGLSNLSLNIYWASFMITGSANQMYESTAVTPPAPVFYFNLFPGGEAEGWMVLQAGQNEEDLMLVFEDHWDWLGDGLRYIALED